MRNTWPRSWVGGRSREQVLVGVDALLGLLARDAGGHAVAPLRVAGVLVTDRQDRASGAVGPRQLWQVQAYDWPWHLAPAWNAMALCGLFVSKPARYWAAHAPLDITLSAPHCEICYREPEPGVYGARGKA